MGPVSAFAHLRRFTGNSALTPFALGTIRSAPTLREVGAHEPPRSSARLPQRSLRRLRFGLCLRPRSSAGSSANEPAPALTQPWRAAARVDASPS